MPTRVEFAGGATVEVGLSMAETVRRVNASLVRSRQLLTLESPGGEEVAINPIQVATIRDTGRLTRGDETVWTSPGGQT